jgi:2-hydroxymuconate-semialdehyde hydrolase
METVNGGGARDRVLAGLAMTTRAHDLDGVRTIVGEIGEGPPLVLVHGAIECGGAVWAPVLARLAERYRLVVPDVPGLGESSPVDRLDVDRFVGWFTALLRATGVERPTVVAHSLMGSLAARAATRLGGVLRRLVVYGAPAVGPYRMPLRLRYAGVRFGLRPTARNSERFERFALLDLDAVRRRDPEWFEAFDAYLRARAAVPHVKRTMRRLVGAETKPVPPAELGRVTVPVSLLWGRQDRMVPVAVARTASARYGWPLHLVDDTAHVPHIERPAEFVEALTAAAGAEREAGPERSRVQG